jgi:hypothetical protein
MECLFHGCDFGVIWRRAERCLQGDILTYGLPQRCNSKALDDFGTEAMIELGWCSEAVVNVVPSKNSLKGYSVDIAHMLERQCLRGEYC